MPAMRMHASLSRRNRSPKRPIGRLLISHSYSAVYTNTIEPISLSQYVIVYHAVAMCEKKERNRVN
jgi:hypothetical protein